jgi:hypothetical protein
MDILSCESIFEFERFQFKHINLIVLVEMADILATWLNEEVGLSKVNIYSHLHKPFRK